MVTTLERPAVPQSRDRTSESGFRIYPDIRTFTAAVISSGDRPIHLSVIRELIASHPREPFFSRRAREGNQQHLFTVASVADDGVVDIFYGTYEREVVSKATTGYFSREHLITAVDLAAQVQNAAGGKPLQLDVFGLWDEQERRMVDRAFPPDQFRQLREVTEGLPAWEAA